MLHTSLSKVIRSITAITLALGLALSQTVQLSATTAGNYAEMGFALAMVPLEIAARRCAQTGTDERGAAALSLTANTLSLANKALFLITTLMRTLAFLGMANGVTVTLTVRLRYSR